MKKKPIKKWKPHLHPDWEFGKFPWSRFGYEGLHGESNMIYVPAAGNEPRHVDVPRKAHIQLLLDGPWIETEHGGSFRPYSIWMVPEGLAFLMEEMFRSAQDDLRRSVKELLKIRETR